MIPVRDPRYDILFEPVQIGPVTARNRFYQVPQCNGMGHRDPSGLAAMRGMKAEGGWAVVATEETEIHPSSDVSPYVEGRIWDDRDIPAHLAVTEAIHAHNSLAAIELTHNGMSASNIYTRVPPMGPSHLPTRGDVQPVQARRMDKSDIADLRRWHREAVERSIKAGYDVVYVYAGHSLSTLQHFLSPRYNTRTDEYGGSLENRSRLLREVLEDTIETVDGRVAVACRITIDELLGDRGFTRAEMTELMGILSEHPDLWDFMVGAWPDDSVSSRFSREADREELIRGLKDLTSKPVVGVGRFTSPDTMVRLIRTGTLDFIGAARPSIADPFLPNKIEQGRIADIRECIGCNICVASDNTIAPIRCTQNPSMGEEWRRGWHPESIDPKHRDEKVLIVGGGPAGMEAAMSAGRRGYDVVLVEASRRLGGRVLGEASLPGLAEWVRVRDYRLGQIDRMRNVETYFESAMPADEILSYGFDHIAICTGSTWRRDGVGRLHGRPIELDSGMEVLTPDDVMAGERPSGGRIAIFDDDHYYMGGLTAELLANEGFSVVLVTSAPDVSSWTDHTLEQRRIQGRLLNLGVEIMAGQAVTATRSDGLEAQCVYTDRKSLVECEAAVFVTSRLPNEALYQDFMIQEAAWHDAGLSSVSKVGDALSPGTIAAAVWDGRRFAEDLGGRSDEALFVRPLPNLAPS